VGQPVTRIGVSSRELATKYRIARSSRGNEVWKRAFDLIGDNAH
jgi:hypothetical protein